MQRIEPQNVRDVIYEKIKKIAMRPVKAKKYEKKQQEMLDNLKAALRELQPYMVLVSKGVLSFDDLRVWIEALIDLDLHLTARTEATIAVAEVFNEIEVQAFSMQFLPEEYEKALTQGVNLWREDTTGTYQLKTLYLEPKTEEFGDDFTKYIGFTIMRAIAEDIAAYRTKQKVLLRGISTKKEDAIKFKDPLLKPKEMYSKNTQEVIHKVITEIYYALLLEFGKNIATVPKQMIQASGVVAGILEILLKIDIIQKKFNTLKNIKIKISAKEVEGLKEDIEREVGCLKTCMLSINNNTILYRHAYNHFIAIFKKIFFNKPDKMLDELNNYFIDLTETIDIDKMLALFKLDDSDDAIKQKVLLKQEHNNIRNEQHLKRLRVEFEDLKKNHGQKFAFLNKINSNKDLKKELKAWIGKNKDSESLLALLVDETITDQYPNLIGYMNLMLQRDEIFNAANRDEFIKYMQEITKFVNDPVTEITEEKIEELNRIPKEQTISKPTDNNNVITTDKDKIMQRLKAYAKNTVIDKVNGVTVIDGIFNLYGKMPLVFMLELELAMNKQMQNPQPIDPITIYSKSEKIGKLITPPVIESKAINYEKMYEEAFKEPLATVVATILNNYLSKNASLDLNQLSSDLKKILPYIGLLKDKSLKKNINQLCEHLYGLLNSLNEPKKNPFALTVFVQLAYLSAMFNRPVYDKLSTLIQRFDIEAYKKSIELYTPKPEALNGKVAPLLPMFSATNTNPPIGKLQEQKEKAVVTPQRRSN